MKKNLVVNEKYSKGFFRSLTLDEKDISFIEMSKGNVLLVGYGREKELFRAQGPMTLIVDRLGYTRNGVPTCTYIRQAVHGHDVKQGAYASSRWLRNLCEKRGAKKICVPGGIPPLCEEGEVLVAAFAQEGTSYYIIPEYAYKQLTNCK